MKIEEIRPIAMKYLRMLEPYCLRIKIAGSIRREKAECGDIEIVCVVDTDERERMKFIAMVERLEKVKGDPTGRYTQRMLPEGVKLDIFMAQEDNWGNIFLIRTGNWKFSRFMMGIRAKQVGLLHRGGYLWHHWEANEEEHGSLTVKIQCYEEEDVFRELKMDWIEPKDREWL